MNNQSGRGARILIAVILLSLTITAYWGAPKCSFIGLDDPVYVTKNYWVQQGLTLGGVRWAFTTGVGGNWHPVTWLSHMTDVQLFGLSAPAHHIVNVVIHCLNVVLLFFLLHTLTGALWRCAFVAAIFALHPLHVESVAWVSERKDVLSTLFGLLTIWFYTAYARSSAGSKQRARNYLAALVAFALSLMSKPMLVTLPCLFLLADFWPLRRFRLDGPDGGGSVPRLNGSLIARLIVEKLPFIALTAASSIATVVAQRNAGAMPTLEQLPATVRAGNAPVAYVLYLAKTFWPHDLGILYPIEVWPTWQIVLATVLLVIISTLAVCRAKRSPYLFTGWFWFVGLLVPVIGIVHVGSQSMADRYTYLPMVGILIVIAWGAVDVSESRAFRILSRALAILAVTLCVVMTRQQLGYWQSSEMLFKHALSFTRKNVILQSTLAAEYIDQGRLDEAFALLTDAISARRDHAESWSNLGAIFGRKGKVEEAAECYAHALSLSPNNPEAQNNLGYLLLTHGKVPEAILHLEVALRYSPHFPEANYNMGNALYLQGQHAGAIRYYERAVQYKPSYAEAHSNLARAALGVGNLELAFAHAQVALELKPDLLAARHALGTVFLKQGQLAGAEACFRALVERQPANANYLDSLGQVMMAKRSFIEASAVYARATQLDPNNAAIYFHAGNAHVALKQIAEATLAYREAIRLQPENAEAHYQLAMIGLNEGRHEEAVKELRTAIQIKPDWTEALNNLAWILATDERPALRDGAEALRLAERAMKTGGETAANLDTLAAAQAEAGRFGEAKITARRALGAAETVGNINLAQQIKDRLEVYSRETPWR